MKRVLVMMGSESDLPTMQKGVAVLEENGVDVEVVVSSAHRDPTRTAELASRAADDGFGVVICGAGLSAALPGVVVMKTQLPVRLAVTGSRSGLPLFEPMAALDRSVALDRLRAARARLP